MSDRVMVFIDGSNLYHCVKKAFGKTGLDISKLVTKLAAGRTLVRTYYYNAPPNPSEDPAAVKSQQRFYGALSWIPRLEVRWGKLLARKSRHVCPYCSQEEIISTHVQKGVDTRLAVDVVTFAIRDMYDIGVIVSGDSDFVEAIRFVKDHARKEIENAFTLEGWSPELRGMAETKTLLDEAFLKDCWLE